MMETKLQQIREHHAAFRKHIEETGNSLRYKELPVLTEEMFLLYEKTGNRLIYENEYFKRREFLVVFGLLVYWYKRPEDIEKLAGNDENFRGLVINPHSQNFMMDRNGGF